MIKIGQKVAFNQFHYMPGGGGAYADHVTGVVTYVNEPHRYFTTEYESGGHTWKMSFKFTDIVGVGERGIVRKVR